MVSHEVQVALTPGPCPVSMSLITIILYPEYVLVNQMDIPSAHDCGVLGTVTYSYSSVLNTTDGAPGMSVLSSNVWNKKQITRPEPLKGPSGIPKD